jgi:hypothetical protein
VEVHQWFSPNDSLTSPLPFRSIRRSAPPVLHGCPSIHPKERKGADVLKMLGWPPIDEGTITLPASTTKLIADAR